MSKMACRFVAILLLAASILCPLSPAEDEGMSNGKEEKSPCAKVSCAFELEEGGSSQPLCHWTAQKTATGAMWINGNENDLYNHHTGVYREADHLTVDSKRGHTEVAGTKGSKGEKVILESPEFVADEAFQFHFKYWLASYGTSLTLCLDKADCVCPSASCLFEVKFDASTKALTEEGPLKEWRPCKRLDSMRPNYEQKCSYWDCAVDAASQAADVPSGTHRLFFVARRVGRFTSIGLDSFHVRLPHDSQPCGRPPKAPAPSINKCYAAGLENDFQHGVLEEYKQGRGKYDGSEEQCKLLCDNFGQCRAVVWYPERAQQRTCILYSATCAEHLDKCHARLADHEAVVYFEVEPCVPPPSPCLAAPS